MTHVQQYSLVIATYNRADTLLTCLRLATEQTRPPNEIVIIDASDDWYHTRQRALDEVAPRLPGTRILYQQASVRSSATQRNEAITLATTDVLFMIDDDSFMYPECAERIMAVYDADRDEHVVGVGAMESAASPLSPQAPADGEHTAQGQPSLKDKIRWKIESLVMVERLLLPYDADYPDHPVPSEILHLDVAATRYLNGMRMTWRAGPARKVLFDETLLKYAAAEDMDFSYRISRFGVIVNALNARLFHAQDPSARLTQHTRALLGMTNLAYLYRRNGHAPNQLLLRYTGRVLTRIAVDLARDLSRGRATMPYVRADLRTLSVIREMARVEKDRLTDWYGKLQERILQENLA
jgi:glycosyltransferase involved in cell wall biosynthesis